MTNATGFATNSLVFEVCNYWNTYESNPKEIAKVFKMARTTVGNYLRRGIELGICNYNSKKELEKSINKRSVPCYLILNDRKIYYRSISEASKSSIKDAGVFIPTTSIRNACKENRLIKGFKYKYLEEDDNEQKYDVAV